MSRRFVLACGAFAVVVLWVITPLSGQSAATGKPSTANGEWPAYTADIKGTKYSPLDQIDASNFNKLQVAWRFKTDHLGPRPEYKLEGTPLMVKGSLYVTAGVRRSVISLDAKTGELIWAHSYREGNRAAIAPRQLSGRGVAYWTDGRGDERVLYVTTGYRLIELNAKTGSMIDSFGTHGVVDLKVGAITGTNTQIDLETGEIGLHSTPAVVGDVAIIGSSMKEGFTPVTHNNTKGLVRAFDVRTGKMLWKFNTIPGPGEFGSDTWENDSWAVNGNTGVWTQITADEELGLVYLPVEDPTSDLYGGHRPGNNLFGDTLVCVDLKTGQRKWHFQLVHHPIWDYDISSAPILADIVVDGRPIKAVLQPSKQSFLYVFDRVTGKPVWPIEERPVPQSDVPGEKTSATQPFPTKPPAYARNVFRVPEDVIDFTPELRAQALEQLKRYKTGPMFLPSIAGSDKGLLGAISLGAAGGGTNWPGAGYDPETHVFYSQAANSGLNAYSVAPPPKGFSDIRYIQGIEGREFRESLGPGFGMAADSPLAAAADAPAPARGTGRGTGRGAPPSAAGAPAGGAAPPVNAGGLTVQGLPIIKPPYGVLSAINVDKGELMWMVPHGDTPDGIKNSPALKGLTLPKTGQAGSVGVLVTKTLVIVGDPGFNTYPDRGRGAMLRAYNKQTGEQVGAVWMPAPQSGSPMTYSVNGKQYVIVAISGANYSGEYLALTLP
ncbi:MAG TPA: PQQ-binding-like beta-propeller repeat protein [Vicinamibacterales bacterium]|jgi:quinoprotein glucose dehydrogenase|nr:PQQ-binding-like beta-propeller repeat protein [Vicinamibacterales bacterium]